MVGTLYNTASTHIPSSKCTLYGTALSKVERILDILPLNSNSLNTRDWSQELGTEQVQRTRFFPAYLEMDQE